LTSALIVVSTSCREQPRAILVSLVFEDAERRQTHEPYTAPRLKLHVDVFHDEETDNVVSCREVFASRCCLVAEGTWEGARALSTRSESGKIKLRHINLPCNFNNAIRWEDGKILRVRSQSLMLSRWMRGGGASTGRRRCLRYR
jgi:hypothetical protein